MSHWSAAPMDRNQVVLFAPTLDQSLADDHPVRLFAETLAALDFAEWERAYVRVVGQPPIHPRVLAGCILYGLTLGVRSSRKLEDAAANRLDFIWLLEGRVPDHATICKFRTAFGPEIKSLFRQVGRVGIELGLVALNRVMLDGTHVQANNSRYATRRRASLREKLDALDAQVERLLAEADLQTRPTPNCSARRARRRSCRGRCATSKPARIGSSGPWRTWRRWSGSGATAGSRGARRCRPATPTPACCRPSRAGTPRATRRSWRPTPGAGSCWTRR
jgi:transposase